MYRVVGVQRTSLIVSERVCMSLGGEGKEGDRDRGNHAATESLETGVSTRQPIAWIEVGVDGRRKEKWKKWK